MLNDEFNNLLSEFNKKDVLKHLILIGSWSLKVYEKNYPLEKFKFITKDIDFLVKMPRGPFPENVENIYNILKNKGYIAKQTMLSNAEKYVPDIAYDNELDIEFLCQPGRHIKEAYTIKKLGISVQPLRFQEILKNNTISLKYNNFEVDVADPIVWAIHKISISQLRSEKNSFSKMENDLNTAKIIVDHFGENKILDTSKNFKGKFLKSFNIGWEKYKELHTKFLLDKTELSL